MKTINKLYEKLELHYKAFDKTKIEPDPLQFLHLYSSALDIELMGFVASVFAYGKVGQIISALNKINSILGKEPVNFVLYEKNIKKTFENIAHRFYSAKDVALLFNLLKLIYTEYGSIQNLYMLNYYEDDYNIKRSMNGFVNKIYEIINKRKWDITHGTAFMFPNPEQGSACKRMNLFLRWMVRKDELDFGLWSKIVPNKLVIPVDTHVARVCKELKLTERKNADWKMAEEITENLKKFDPADPVKYDFAICHIGMRKLKL
jgi:TIGR02757 family protein